MSGLYTAAEMNSDNFKVVYANLLSVVIKLILQLVDYFWFFICNFSACSYDVCDIADAVHIVGFSKPNSTVYYVVPNLVNVCDAGM